MIYLYHGSPFEFETPDPSYGKSYRDFGPGFYLAEEEIDATTIAIKDSWSGYLYTYEVDDDSLFRNFSAIEFDGFDEAWAEFVFNNRMYNDQNGYEVIVGPTAGGHVNDLFEKYRREEAVFEDVCNEMLNEITHTRFGMQWCITNTDCLDYVQLIDVEEITR